MPNPEYKIKTYPKGKTIFTEGSPADYLFIIKSGKVEVFKTVRNKKIILAELNEGELLGEMAMFLPENQRTASARAKAYSELIAIDSTTFMKSLENCPVIIESVLKAMAERLKLATETIQARSSDKPLLSICAILLFLLGNKCTQPANVPCPYCTIQNTIPHDIAYSAVRDILMLTNEEISFYINKAINLKLLRRAGNTYQILDTETMLQKVADAYDGLNESLNIDYKQESVYSGIAELSKEYGISIETLKDHLKTIPGEALVINKDEASGWIEEVKRISEEG